MRDKAHRRKSGTVGGQLGIDMAVVCQFNILCADCGQFFAQRLSQYKLARRAGDLLLARLGLGVKSHITQKSFQRLLHRQAPFKIKVFTINQSINDFKNSIQRKCIKI